jgi:hypothetical protein
MIGFARRGHRVQQRGREYPARRGDAQRKPEAEPDRRAEGAPRRVDVPRAERLADLHRRRHAEAEHRGEDQEHHHVGVGRRRQRAFAQQPPDPDRIDRSVERLENVGGQRWRGKQQQRAQDRTLGQIAMAAGRCRARS